MTRTTYLLTGDIGGTNSRMGLYHSTDDGTPLAQKDYRNQEVLTEQKDGIFEQNVIAPFLRFCWENNRTLAPLDQVEIVACLAIAGTVQNNRVSITNLHNILVDGTAIVEQRNFKNNEYLSKIKVCKIINDFVAQGYGCLTLHKDHVQELHPGSWERVNPRGPKVCVGAGTGLGECYLTPDDAHGTTTTTTTTTTTYTCFPSEGGHVEWAPRNDLEIKLWRYLKEKFDYQHRVSVERVVSGPGLANCYEFLAKEFPERVDPNAHARFEQADEDTKGKVVSDQAKAQKGSLFAHAAEIMFGAYGSAVGSAAVQFIPTGGLFVTGGLTPKNMEFIAGPESPFRNAYRDKGRVAPLLQTVPLFAVLGEDLGVRGALKCAQMEYQKYYSGNETKADDTKKAMIYVYMAAAAAVGALVGTVMVSHRKR